MQDATTPNRQPRAWTTLVVQVAGLLVGLALLAWCVSIALRPQNRAQLEQLSNAGPGAIAGLLGLSFASLLANGGVFWSLLRPAPTLAERRGVAFWRMQAVNAVATCLAYVPFKLSILFRFFAHRTQDRVPIGTIAALLAAAAASLVTVCGPVLGWALVGLDHSTLVLASAGSSLAIAATGWAIARALSGERGLTAIRAFADRLRPSLLGQVARSPKVAHLHAGFDMVGHGPSWFVAIGFRAVDLTVQATRFWFAAQVLGLQLEPWSALVLGAVYYTLGAASPSGALGIREGGATGVAKLMQLSGGDTYAAVTLLVTAADAIPTILAAVAGVLVVRPWRVLRGSSERHPPEPGSEQASGPR